MNEDMQDFVTGAPSGAVERSSKKSGGGGAVNRSCATAGRRELAWNCPTVTILHLGRRTDTSPSNTIFPNPESVEYDFVERS